MNTVTRLINPQFRSIIPCEVLLYIEVTFWDLSIDLGIFRSSWFLHRHKIGSSGIWSDAMISFVPLVSKEDLQTVHYKHFVACITHVVQ